MKKGQNQTLRLNEDISKCNVLSKLELDQNIVKRDTRNGEAITLSSDKAKSGSATNKDKCQITFENPAKKVRPRSSYVGTTKKKRVSQLEKGKNSM